MSLDSREVNTVIEWQFEKVSLTNLERSGLDAPLNLSDGHARIHDDAAITAAFASAPELFDLASNTAQSDLESEFWSIFGALNNLRFPRSPILSYSSTCLASLIGQSLGAGSRILWPVPSFDNLRDVVASAGPQIVPVDEGLIVELLLDDSTSGIYDAAWLTLPNNPSGMVLDEAIFRAIVESVARHRKVLILDSCFRAFSPTLSSFNQYEILESEQLSYFVLDDTGKTLSTLDLKVGLLTCDRASRSGIEILNEDVLLNVSSFTLALLSDIMKRWITVNYIPVLRDKIAANRTLIRAAVESCGLSSDMKSDEIPLEWARAPTPEAARYFMARCSSQGLRILPGGSFFHGARQLNCKHVRIALARDLNIVQHGVKVVNELKLNQGETST
jgi:aspartate/methionine/tyrosine aminotransferase